ncbi:hypothetical protein OH799_14185 [Nocardia sp. NBC_00881]|uniref:hypothetical protein n=1 Tax=Nocardia sp. NBC_00881 TaxID=2975995 RepID=UPI0038635EFD|nr:hypothetical protein OH799_14185 [Nocardia sp. NBC_00881]
MATVLPAFTPVEAGLYLTLRGRALYSRQERSILPDPTLPPARQPPEIMDIRR